MTLTSRSLGHSQEVLIQCVWLKLDQVWCPELVLALAGPHWGRINPGAKKIHHEKKVYHINIWLIIYWFPQKTKSATGKFERKCHFNFLTYGKPVKIPIKYENFQRFFCHLCSKYTKYPYSIIYFLKGIIKAHLVI